VTRRGEGGDGRLGGPLWSPASVLAPPITTLAPTIYWVWPSTLALPEQQASPSQVGQ